MTAQFILLRIISLIVLVLAVIILSGKGDNLIAGYNTSTEEEKETYNIKRVRICIGGMLLILSPIMLMFADHFIILIPILGPRNNATKITARSRLQPVGRQKTCP